MKNFLVLTVLRKYININIVECKCDYCRDKRKPEAI